ncbi:MAG: hypothetical protein NDJ89_09610 [Oligoflexia bacterium]|nr:hypothetical protein [Oligoflexia bacterium]
MENLALAKMALADESQKEAALLLLQLIEQGADIEVQTFDLATARSENDPFEVGSFRSIWIASATDSSAEVSFRPNSRNKQQGAVPLTKNAVFSQIVPMARGYFHWSAQAGKTMTVVMSRLAEIRPGSLINQLAGGVTLADGSSFTVSAAVLAAATAGLIVAQDTDRKCLTFVNESGADLWIGGASVSNAGANKGVLVVAGEKVVWRNTAALYGYSVAGTTLTCMNER